MRDFCADVTLSLDDFVMPLFIRNGSQIEKPIDSMPGISQMSPDVALAFAKSLNDRGISKFIFFGIVDQDEKDATGSVCLQDDSPVSSALRLFKESGIEAILIADLCFCEYTDHGHCGVLSKDPATTIDNEATLEILCRQAIALAKAGADIIAPSGMIDGMVSAIRSTLDESGYSPVAIMSYSTKFCSHLYGPFREAGEGAPAFGDRKAYQMDFRRKNEWVIETEMDIAEGADFLMVKPGIAYLDILSKVSEFSSVPVGVYQVSGEYSMILAAAEKGWADPKEVALETSYAFKRSGANFIISYFSKDMPDWL
jgi:porphobilinogen synthase